MNLTNTATMTTSYGRTYAQCPSWTRTTSQRSLPVRFRTLDVHLRASRTSWATPLCTLSMTSASQRLGFLVRLSFVLGTVFDSGLGTIFSPPPQASPQSPLNLRHNLKKIFWRLLAAATATMFPQSSLPAPPPPQSSLNSPPQTRPCGTRVRPFIRSFNLKGSSRFYV